MKINWVLCDTKGKQGLNIPDSTADLMLGILSPSSNIQGVSICTVDLGRNYPSNEMYANSYKGWSTRSFIIEQVKSIYSLKV